MDERSATCTDLERGELFTDLERKRLAFHRWRYESGKIPEICITELELGPKVMGWLQFQRYLIATGRMTVGGHRVLDRSELDTVDTGRDGR